MGSPGAGSKQRFVVAYKRVSFFYNPDAGLEFCSYFNFQEKLPLSFFKLVFWLSFYAWCIPAGQDNSYTFSSSGCLETSSWRAGSFLFLICSYTIYTCTGSHVVLSVMSSSMLLVFVFVMILCLKLISSLLLNFIILFAFWFRYLLECFAQCITLVAPNLSCLLGFKSIHTPLLCRTGGIEEFGQSLTHKNVL